MRRAVNCSARLPPIKSSDDALDILQPLTLAYCDLNRDAGARAQAAAPGIRMTG
jgi:hypothetical protein